MPETENKGEKLEEKKVKPIIIVCHLGDKDYIECDGGLILVDHKFISDLE